MTNSKETRTITRYRHVTEEFSVEELRARADAMELPPYGAAEVISVEKAHEKCLKKDVTKYLDGERTFYCQNPATHYYFGVVDVGAICEACAREEAKERAEEFRKKFRL